MLGLATQLKKMMEQKFNLVLLFTASLKHHKKKKLKSSEIFKPRLSQILDLGS